MLITLLIAESKIRRNENCKKNNTKKDLSFDKSFKKLGWKDSNLRNGGTKNRCLTTWRHPITGYISIIYTKN